MTFLFKKYDELCKLVIKPSRQIYHEQDLGLPMFMSHDETTRIIRKEFNVENKEKINFNGSVWIPHKK